MAFKPLSIISSFGSTRLTVSFSGVRTARESELISTGANSVDDCRLLISLAELSRGRFGVDGGSGNNTLGRSGLQYKR